MSNCIFCKIVAGTIPATKLYEDDDVLAFMDIGPIVKGHVLVIPKTHTETIGQTPPETLAQTFFIFIHWNSNCQIYHHCPIRNTST